MKDARFTGILPQLVHKVCVCVMRVGVRGKWVVEKGHNFDVSIGVIFTLVLFHSSF